MNKAGEVVRYECGITACGVSVPRVCPTHGLKCAGKLIVPESAQPCGCDPGASHICEWHRSNPEFARVSRPVPSPDTFIDVSFSRTNPALILPTGAAERKQIPIATGVLDYFPKALAAVAEVSAQGSRQHHPGEPLHWDRSKSTDQADCLIRHFLERGTLDTDGQRHSAKVCWRALALLELELEAEGK